MIPVLKAPVLIMLAGACITSLETQPLQELPAPKWTAKDVAGTYYFGDGLGVNCTLVLSEDTSFKFRWTGCLGEYGANLGSFQIEGNELVLKPTKDNPNGFGGTKTRFYPVAWGKRLYMIAPDEMSDFCRKVALGWDGGGVRGAIRGHYYVRLDPNNGRELPPVSGSPQVPEKFKSLLEAGLPVRVTGVKRGVISLDKGSNQGLEKGAILYESRYALPWLKVTKVSQRVAQAAVLDEDYPAPEVGERFRAYVRKHKAKS